MIISIITIRNRDSARIEALISSLRAHGADTPFLVADYGSDEPFAESYRALADKGLFQLLRMETQGRPWNKCHAINAAVRATSEPWIATIDVDMVFDCNPFPYCLKNQPDHKVQVMQANFLPQNGDRARAVFGGKGHPGGFVFQSRSAFVAVGGYDESIQYWGMEDWDWVNRLEKMGYPLEWIPEAYRFYHTWHPTANDPSLRPVTASYETSRALTRNESQPTLVQDWGRSVTRESRPVLAYLESTDIPVFEIPSGEWGRRLSALREVLTTESVVKVTWGSRKVKRKLDSWTWLHPFLNTLVTPFGLSPERAINSNFDYWYAVRDLLADWGVSDWYLDPSLDFLLLLKEP